MGINTEGVVLIAYGFSFIMPICLFLPVLIFLCIYKPKLKFSANTSIVQQVNGKYMVQFALWFGRIFLGIGLIASCFKIIPLSMDIPYALSRDYVVQEVVLTEAVPRNQNSRSLTHIYVRSVETGEEFDFISAQLSVAMEEGQRLEIQILPHSRYGGYKLIEETE